MTADDLIKLLKELTHEQCANLFEIKCPDCDPDTVSRCYTCYRNGYITSPLGQRLEYMMKEIASNEASRAVDRHEGYYD